MKKNAGLLEIRLKDMGLDDKKVQQHIDLKPGKYLQLSIGDTGNGMPKEILANIFDPLRISACKEGLFPGLSLVQGMVREMGGAISVCNESEKGIHFPYSFPEI